MITINGRECVGHIVHVDDVGLGMMLYLDDTTGLSVGDAALIDDGHCEYYNRYIVGIAGHSVVCGAESDIPSSLPSLEERINDLEIALCEIVDALG